METALFLAILTICPTGLNCFETDGFVRFISEPFEAVQGNFITGDLGDVHTTCQEQLNMLSQLYLSEGGSRSHLCVRKDVWDSTHPVTIEPLDESAE